MSLIVQAITQDFQEWERLITLNPAASFHQSTIWAAFQDSIGWSNTLLGIYSGEKLIGGANVYRFVFPNNTDFLYIPGGPVLSYEDDEQLFDQWRVLMPSILELIDQEGRTTTHIRIEPLVSTVPEWMLSAFVKAPYNLLPSHTQCINLELSDEELLADMKQKGRYNLMKARKSGVTIESLSAVNEGDIADFYSLYKDTFERNAFNGKSIRYFQNLFDSAGQIASLFFASYKGKRIAAAILIQYGDAATYLYGASSSKYRDLNPSYLLQWEMMLHAKEKGMRIYDFWGVAPNESMKEHLWYGMTRFKKSLGGYQVDRVGAYDQVIHKEAYDAFVEQHESS